MYAYMMPLLYRVEIYRNFNLLLGIMDGGKDCEETGLWNFTQTGCGKRHNMGRLKTYGAKPGAGCGYGEKGRELLLGTRAFSSNLRLSHSTLTLNLISKPGVAAPLAPLNGPLGLTRIWVTFVSNPSTGTGM